MKIKVHEIEGDYYCAVDDIARLKLSKRIDTNAYKEVINLHAKRYLYIYFTNNQKKQIVDGGVYLGNQGTPPIYADYQATPIIRGLQKIIDLRAVIHHGNTTRDIPISENTDYRDIKGFIVYSLENKEAFRDLDILSKQKNIGRLIHTGLGIVETRLLFVHLPYVKTYLANIATDDDFIMPDNEPVTQQTKPTTEQATTETQSILNDQSDYFSPYLAIAIDIWERAYVYGEARETSNKLDPIIKLIEKHYPQIEADTVKKQIADIIVTKRGTPLDKVEAKPRQSK